MIVPCVVVRDRRGIEGLTVEMVEVSARFRAGQPEMGNGGRVEKAD